MIYYTLTALFVVLVLFLEVALGHLVWNIILAPLLGLQVLAWWKPGVIWLVFSHILRALVRFVRQ